MNDCISRQIISDYVESHILEIISESGIDHNGHTNRILRMIVDYIEKMPSVTPTGHWVPVSERLPEYNKEVLCFLSSDEYAVCYLINNWGNDEFVDGGLGTGAYDVVAWIPLPTPYEPQESEEISERNIKMWEDIFKAESEE